MDSGLPVILLLCCSSLCAQSIHVPVKRAFPVVSGYSQNLQDPFAAAVNHAQLASVTQPAVAIYNERKFMLKELSLFQCAFVLPHRSGGYRVTLMHTGGQSYNETCIAAGFGKRLGDMLLLGFQFNYLHAKTGTEKQYNRQA